MTHSLLVSSTLDQSDALPWHDRIQIALGIADELLLKSLLVDSTPPIARSHRIGGVRSTIGVPTATGIAVDGSLEFEELHCVLADSAEQLEQSVADYCHRNGNHRGYVDLTRCETETQSIGQSMSLSHAISLLAHAGFASAQVESILKLPHEGWFKSWWYQIDEVGEFTIPFLRLIRTRHYADGTLTLQYKDFFSQEPPSCFKSRPQKVLVEILPEQHQFAATLAKINAARQQTGITQALLICDRLSDLEARGFISQGISLYTAEEVILPVQANCSTCATSTCPLQGRSDSPVLLCQQFCLTPA